MPGIVPIDLNKISNEFVVKENIRNAIIDELIAINAYEQNASMIQNNNISKILLDIAREEKVHVGELMTILTIIDKEQLECLKEGQDEVGSTTPPLRKGLE